MSGTPALGRWTAGRASAAHIRFNRNLGRSKFLQRLDEVRYLLLALGQQNIVGFSHQLYSRVGVDVVMESITVVPVQLQKAASLVGEQVMSSWVRTSFCWQILFFLSCFGLTCSTALAQQSFGSTSDNVPPDTPQPTATSSSVQTRPQGKGAGAITGTVLDANGDVLPGARVTVAGQLGSLIRILESGSNGEFAFTELHPDTYQVEVTAPGMISFMSSSIPCMQAKPAFCQ